MILKQRGKTTIVQCKAHKKPVGPAVVRELYGSMYDYGADSAVLACPGEFTEGVLDFTQDKKITLKSGHPFIIGLTAAILGLAAFCLLTGTYQDFRNHKQPSTHQDKPPRADTRATFNNCLIFFTGISLWG